VDDLKGKNATISDVARLAGVSMKTVSRVLNNEKYVSKDKKEKVLAVAAQLNYRPSLQARGLAGNRSYMIGLFVDDPSGDYISKVQRGILRRCEEAGCYLVVDVLRERGNDAKLRQILNSIRFDGVVLSSPVCDDVAVLDALRERKVPTVRIGPGVDASDMAQIEIDDYKAAFEATEYLIKLGHTRIGFVKGDPNHGCSLDREQGYSKAMRAHGITVSNDLVAPGMFSYDSGYAAAETLLKRDAPPTAIFASNDEMAAGVVACAQSLGLRVPADLSVMGFDDDFLSTIMSPAITTVRQPIEDMAASAVDLILEAKGKSAALEDKTVIFDYELIIRKSVQKLPA